jgi:uncharacterized lipoprotein YddW (UPF0748 family)
MFAARAKRIGLNALIVQLRGRAADALYLLDLEPSSEFLVGQQGAHASRRFRFPLDYWIQSCKKMACEFHAWFNPDRARIANAKSSSHPKHVAKQQPQLVVKYGEQWWMNPAEPKALQWTLGVIEDVVNRYDLDGIVDDLYPYPVKAQERKSSGSDFPDEIQFKRYLKQGGNLSKAAWRRQHVDGMVRSLMSGSANISPGCGWASVLLVWVSRHCGRLVFKALANSISFFADVERWCAESWFDYLAPQLYWRIDQRAQAFEVLLQYWAQQINKKRHLWPGIYASSI